VTAPEEQAWEDPQARLRRVIDRFAAEHRDDLRADARWQDAGPEPAPPTSSEAVLVDAPALERDDDVP